MASLQQRKGKWLIQFTSATSKRCTLRLGSIRESSATKFRAALESALDEQKLTSQPSPQSMAWLQSLPSRTRSQLEECGLLPPAKKETTLRQLCDRLLSKPGLKESTLTMYGHTARNLKDCYGEETPIAEVAARAADFRPFLALEKLSPVTQARRVRVARQFFSDVQDEIKTNPFKAVKAGRATNPARQRYISREIVDRVIMADEYSELSMVLALSRYGGLRVPSEIDGMLYSDVDWENGTLLVRSPKTAQHPGGSERIIPFFPELRQRLRNWFWCSGSKSLVFPKSSELSNSALRTALYKRLKRLGITPWPKLFHNLRASAETDWCKSVPIHVAACWAGHRPNIAAEHYLMVTTDWLQKATTSAGSVSHQGAYSDAGKSTTDGVNVTSDTDKMSRKGLIQNKAARRKRGRAAISDVNLRRQQILAKLYSRAVSRLASSPGQPDAEVKP